MTRFLAFSIALFGPFSADAQLLPFPESPAVPATAAEIEYEGKLFQLSNSLENASLAIICSEVWGPRQNALPKTFDAVAIDLVEDFATTVREDNFQLPEWNENFSPILVDTIDAPTTDIAVGMIYARRLDEAKELVRTFETAFDSVVVEGPLQYISRSFDAGRIYPCENLFSLINAED